MADDKAALRARAKTTIRDNLVAQSQLGGELRDAIPTGLLATQEQVWKGGERAMERMNPGVRLPNAPKLIAKMPGLVFDAAQLATAKDKMRAAAGIVGGHLSGAAMGGAMGELGGPYAEYTIPIGAFTGAVVGEAGMKRAYDYVKEHKDDIVRAGGDAVTRGWGPSADPVMRRGLLGPW